MEEQPAKENVEDTNAEERDARAKTHGLTVAQRAETVEADQASQDLGSEGSAEGAGRT